MQPGGKPTRDFVLAAFGYNLAANQQGTSYLLLFDATWRQANQGLRTCCFWMQPGGKPTRHAVVVVVLLLLSLLQLL